MCGIGGRLVPIGSVNVDGWEAVGGRLLRALAHRGPDGQGIYSSSNGGAGLVHTRLAILDLSPAGRQPMKSPDGRYCLTFNGEIYNYRQLRDELEKLGRPLARASGRRHRRGAPERACDRAPRSDGCKS